LVAFYYEIIRNIEKGILTEMMYDELELIYTAAKEKNVDIIYKQKVTSKYTS